jgi:hypothetical protein
VNRGASATGNAAVFIGPKMPENACAFCEGSGYRFSPDGKSVLARVSP